MPVRIVFPVALFILALLLGAASSDEPQTRQQRDTTTTTDSIAQRIHQVATEHERSTVDQIDP